jgi:hypothetical protein
MHHASLSLASQSHTLDNIFIIHIFFSFWSQSFVSFDVVLCWKFLPDFPSKSNPYASRSLEIDIYKSFDFFIEMQVGLYSKFDLSSHRSSSFLSEFDLFGHRSLSLSYKPSLYIYTSSDLGVSKYDIFDISLEPCNIGSLPTNSIYDFNFGFPFVSNLFACRSSNYGNIESSLVDSTIKMDIVEDIKVENIHVPLTFSKSLLWIFKI